MTLRLFSLPPACQGTPQTVLHPSASLSSQCSLVCVHPWPLPGCELRRVLHIPRAWHDAQLRRRQPSVCMDLKGREGRSLRDREQPLFVTASGQEDPCLALPWHSGQEPSLGERCAACHASCRPGDSEGAQQWQEGPSPLTHQAQSKNRKRRETPLRGPQLSVTLRAVIRQIQLDPPPHCCLPPHDALCSPGKEGCLHVPNFRLF